MINEIWKIYKEFLRQVLCIGRPMKGKMMIKDWVELPVRIVVSCWCPDH